MSLRSVIKETLPEPIRRVLTGIFYGWHGSYASWDDAAKKCSGYNSAAILQKVKDAASKVRDGVAHYERDSVIFDEIQYSYPLLTGLLWSAARRGGKLNVLDFGGSLGSTYYQNKIFLDSLNEVNWCIVEQPEFVKEGRALFSNGRLNFFYTVAECFKSFRIDLVLFSSVLQYLEKPYELLEQIIKEGPEIIIIDRTPFVAGEDRLTVQKVNPSIYKASYPCWFFNKEKFLGMFGDSYNLVLEFEALDRANIKSEFLGFIFQKINNKTNPR